MSSKNQNSSSGTEQHLLENLAYVAACNPKMFTILKISKNELHLHILGDFLISIF